MSKKPSLWQGRLDNFCGIYCAAHVLMESERLAQKASDRPQRAFYWLLKSAEAKNWLNAESIAGFNAGFDDASIAEVFNGVPALFRRGLAALAFSSYKGGDRALSKAVNGWDPGTVSLIVKERGLNHWILARKVDDGYDCFDSWIKNPKVRRRRIAWDQGVVIAPKKLIGILNAQTH